jgi:hypothetical protein
MELNQWIKKVEVLLMDLYFAGNFIDKWVRRCCHSSWCAAEGTRYTTVTTVGVSCSKRINGLN